MAPRSEAPDAKANGPERHLVERGHNVNEAATVDDFLANRVDAQLRNNTSLREANAVLSILPVTPLGNDGRN
jgi:hypothetical protein